jgi:phenylalanyl-tRNA synthetase beta chain
VEHLEPFVSVPGGLAGLVIGEVLTCVKHPDADKLSLTTVDIGQEEPSQIVCGASNVAAGQKVVVATVGATLYPSTGEPFEIKKAKIRGQASEGMICAEDEIGIGTSHAGIIVLDTDLPNGSPASAYFEVTQDLILEIGLTPNRADAASHLGVARDLKALLRRDLCLPVEPAIQVEAAGPSLEVVVDQTSDCPRYAGIVLTGIEVKPSPQWLQHFLRSLGLEPINNVVDITNLVMLETGQPLHAFDRQALAEGSGGNADPGSLGLRQAYPAEPFLSLDGEERSLNEEALVVTYGNQPIALAGVMGGAETAVKTHTKAIWLEAAVFPSQRVRRSSRSVGLRTESSARFEKGLPMESTLHASDRAVALFQDLAGAKAVGRWVLQRDDRNWLPLLPSLGVLWEF